MITIDEKEYGCPVDIFTDIFNDKYKMYIVWYLQDGPKRFKELSQLIDSTTQKTLSAKLKDLEARHLIHREAFAEIPPRVEYSLTPIGIKLKPLLKQLFDWGEDYAVEFSDAYTRVCNTPKE